jgi:hypothetical protein
MMQFFANTFKDNIAQVAAVIDDTLLKPCRDHRFIVLEKRLTTKSRCSPDQLMALSENSRTTANQ